MKNRILENGIFGGMIVSITLISMTLYMKSNSDSNPSAIIGFGSMLLGFIFVIRGIKQERESYSGLISFRKAFVTGSSISLVISIIYVIVWLIVYYNFFPNFMEQYTAMILKKTSPKELAAKTAEMNQMIEWYKNPIMIIFLTLTEILPIGIVVSLIGALVLKNKSKE